MEIKGTVESIRFRNEENGYTVAVVETERTAYVVVGCFPPVSEGSFVACTGELINNPKFGMQIKADSVRIAMPETEYSLYRFLSSGTIKGIGPKKADAIIKRFGTKALEVIEKTPMKLICIPGINIKTAKSISNSFIEVRAASESITFLMQGMSVNTAFKVYNRYGNDTIALVSTNPYRLIEDIPGIGFLTADKLATSIGIDRNSRFRIEAGILHVMMESAERNGNTVQFRGDIVSDVIKLLAVTDEDLINRTLDSLILSRKIKEVECEGEKGLMHFEFFIAESRAAIRLVALLNAENKAYPDCAPLIEEFERINRVSFHENQRLAILTAVKKGVSIITGGPGTGKTTIVNCIKSILEYHNRRIALLAPTGRAAKRLSEATGRPASTIHRMLLSEDVELSGEIQADVVIIDEFSMVDSLLLYRLLTVIPDTAKIIIVGDSNQLPSVGPGNCLSDMIKCGLIPVTKLTYIYRQNAESMIVSAAHDINNGKCPNLHEKKSDFFFIPADGQQSTSETVVSLATKRLPAYLNVTPDKIQVLCPIKTGLAGSVALNQTIREAVLGKPAEKVKVGDAEFAKGDKVMHVVNNYDLKWRRGGFEGKGVFNGDMGTVTAVYPGSGEIEVTFEDERIAHYAGDDRDELSHAYAITVHKSQGSEYDGVVIPAVSANYMIMTRNLLYTAVTRAKRLVVIVGSEECVRKMVSNNYVRKRYSMLAAFIRDYFDKMTVLYSESGE